MNSVVINNLENFCMVDLATFITNRSIWLLSWLDTFNYYIKRIAKYMYNVDIVEIVTSISMLETYYGAFDGNSWEELFQLIYKKRYGSYQEMVSSPGDWGIEGFVRGEGIAIQCYCPKENYGAGELHSNQVAKINKDIKKLSDNEIELTKRIGTDDNDLIKEWIFITPVYKKNELLVYVQKKEKELRSKNLQFIAPNVKILLHDADHYRDDIHHIKHSKGEKTSFYSGEKLEIEKIENTSDYDRNIERKNKIRSFKNGEYSEKRHGILNRITREKFILGDGLIRKIEISFPEIYKIISRTINQYELEVEEICVTWCGNHYDLTEKIKSELKIRLNTEEKIESTLSSTDINEIVDHMISKWIALCPLEIE
ncbi:hypothetical protein AB4166_02375 [Vibrio splendidus]